MKSKRWRVVASVCIVLVGAGFIVGLYAIGLTAQSAVERDFIEYWAAGQELVHGGNPYDPAAILKMERSAGWDQDFPKVSFSPPIMLLLAWPLGYLSAKTGLVVWLLASLACLLLSVWIIWLVYGKSESRLHLIGFAFPSVLACLMTAQVGIYFLLEVALFLYFHKTRPWLAGAALVFFSMKPHLVLPCFLVVLLGSIARREFKVLAGLLMGLAVCCGVVAVLDGHAWNQYQQMLRSTRIMDLFLPTLAVGLRFLIDRQARWLEFIPEVAGCIWAIWYFWSRRDNWNWLDQGHLLLLVSVVCAPYQWITDQAIFFPAVLAGLYWAERSTLSLALFVLIAGGELIGVFGHIQPPSAFYIWTAPAWLLWYLFAARGDRTSKLVAPEMVASAS